MLMMWAERRTGTRFGRHTVYNWFTANLKEEESDSEDDDDQVLQNPYVHKLTSAEMWFRHGIAMTISWFPLAFLTLATNRWGAVFWRKRQILHSLFGFIATILTMYSGSMAIAEVGGIDAQLHELLGTFIYIFVLVLTGLGMAAMILRKLSVWNSKTPKIV
jgi:hypothetical protein